MIEIGKGRKRSVKDYMLTRYACYLIAQNGDPRKEEIAFAQSYFALQTRKQERIEERMTENDLRGESPITTEHVRNNEGVRSLLGERGIKPEELPGEEDVKKLRRKVQRDERELEATSQGFGQAS